MGAGIFGVLNVLVIAELTKGTGRFNLAQGATATAIGIGAAASNAGAGGLAKHAGHSVTFFTLAGVTRATIPLHDAPCRTAVITSSPAR